jgi:phenylacetate-CoA ligase
MTHILKKARDFGFRYLPLPFYYGREFRKVHASLKKSSRWNREQMQEYKLTRLKALVKHAGENVPYYRGLFEKQGIHYSHINSFEDFARIPVLTKDDLRENSEKLKADNFRKYKPIHTHTSGTTSEITFLYRSAAQEAWRKAVLWRLFERHGLDFRSRRCTILAPRSFDIDSPPYEHDRIENNLIVNGYHIVKRHFNPIIEKIREFRPRMIWTPPNIFCVLADYMIENNYPPIDIPLVITFAERTAEYIKRRLMKAFPGKYLEHYGNRENSVSSWGNCDGKFYEISEYCHLEVTPGSLLKTEPNAGDLISTSLHNYAFPLIRYNTEDIAEWLGYEQTDSAYPQIHLIGGRGKDLLLTKGGLIVPYFTYYLEQQGFFKLIKGQIEQTAIDELIIRLVPGPDYDRGHDEPLLREHAKAALGHEFKLKFDYVDDIPFGSSGKFSPAISKLAIDYLNKD